MKIGIGSWWLFGITFIALRLCGVIAWPWSLVTLPLWGPVFVVIMLLSLAIIAAMSVLSAVMAVATVLSYGVGN